MTKMPERYQSQAPWIAEGGERMTTTDALTAEQERDAAERLIREVDLYDDSQIGHPAFASDIRLVATRLLSLTAELAEARAQMDALDQEKGWLRWALASLMTERLRSTTDGARILHPDGSSIELASPTVLVPLWLWQEAQAALMRYFYPAAVATTESEGAST